MPTSEELHSFLRARRSVRRFRPAPIQEDILRRMLATAARAPSAHNDQPWRFAILQTEETKSRLAQAMAQEFRQDLERDGLPAEEIARRLERSRRRITEAPAIVILCMQHRDGADGNELRRAAERTMAVQSVALAGLQLLLAAHAEGLGGVWTCGPLFAPGAVRAALALPGDWEPQAMLLVGFPDEAPAPPPSRPLDEITVWR